MDEWMDGDQMDRQISVGWTDRRRSNRWMEIRWADGDRMNKWKRGEGMKIDY